MVESLKVSDEGKLFEGHLKENEYKLVVKKVDLKKVLNSLSEYKKAESEYKKYIEDQQKQLSEKAEKIKKDSEDLEKKWSETKERLQEEKNRGEKNREEYEDEFGNEEKNYNYKKSILEERYRLLMGEQNTMENDARVKRNELFNPIEKKTTKFIDEYATLLGNKLSEIRIKNNKKPVKIIVLYSDSIANSESYTKNILSSDITTEIIDFIKEKKGLKENAGE